MPRIVSYNVHRCLGVDGKLSPKRIADVIAACEPDIVALQELDVGRARTGAIDQAHSIAEALGMQMHFHPALRVMEEQYGDAILTARPSRIIKAGPLPGLAGWLHMEPRGALWPQSIYKDLNCRLSIPILVSEARSGWCRSMRCLVRSGLAMRQFAVRSSSRVT